MSAASVNDAAVILRYCGPASRLFWDLSSINILLFFVELRPHGFGPRTIEQDKLAFKIEDTWQSIGNDQS